MANKEGTESGPNITSYIENTQNGLAAHWGGKASLWLITLLLDLGSMGAIAPVALHLSQLAIWNARKWHTFHIPSKKTNLDPASYDFLRDSG